MAENGTDSPLRSRGGGGSGSGGKKNTPPTSQQQQQQHRQQQDVTTREWLVHINSHEANAPFKYKDNRISTTKYNIITFLPKNLFEQFHRLANIYFLFIVILNWLPPIQAFGREVAMIPLIFVLAVTAIKDLFEDRRRARSDSQVNNSFCDVLQPDGTFHATKWKAVQVGDVIKLKTDQIIPADLLLISSEAQGGVCYVETANLDGETNLKQRRIFLDPELPVDMSNFKTPVVCEWPNNRIYEFNGHVTVNGRVYPLDPTNMLLRGCVLRNTPSITGVVLYAGHETKAMLNNTGPRSKRSKLERMMNRQIIYCCVILFVLCFIGGLGSGIWLSRRDYEDVLYLPYQSGDPAPPAEGVIRFWTFFIVLQVMVPISLYISIELVKLAQVYFIQEDIDLYYLETDSKMWCRALNITEDLGQIEYIFSDKTGTLTQNKMIFRRCSIGGQIYSHSAGLNLDVQHTEDILNLSSVGEATCNPDNDSIPMTVLNKLPSQFTFTPDKELMTALSSDSGERGNQSTELHFFWLAAAACNTVVPTCPLIDAAGHVREEFQKPALGAVKFEAESPDEAALVAAAQMYGYTLVARASDWIEVHVKNSLFRYKVLAVLPFDSARKKASIILRCPDNSIVLLCKGADASIADSLASPQFQDIQGSTQSHIDEFAHAGLRTLSFAYRYLTEDYLASWLQDFTRAQICLENRAEELLVVYNAIECNLQLLGATGIEDRLQDGVPDAVGSLREANLKIWMLTGDKMETAIQIAHTCNLMTSETEKILLRSNTASTPYDKNDAAAVTAHVAHVNEEVAAMLAHHSNMVQAKEYGLVIDGATLAYALKPAHSKQFLELACRCKAVVCCRATPLQKAQVVQLVKVNKKVMTLAIGDGANDVSMIQMADIGVGISGQEGMQAVMASDFAIAQFRFLRKLLLVHGHWSYDRMANMILFFYYKNTVFVFILFWFQFFCGFSAQSCIDQLYLMMYNLLWTSLPVMVTGIFDQDASTQLLQLNPVLYEQGQKDLSYKGKFWPIVVDSIYQSVVIFFIPYLAYRYSDDADMTVFGTTLNTAVVLAATIQIGLRTRLWNWMNFFSVGLSLFLYFAFALVYNAICCSFVGIVPSMYMVMEHCFTSALFWACITFTPLVAVAPHVVVLLYTAWFYPTASEYAREDTILKKRELHPSHPIWSPWNAVTTCLCPSTMTDASRHQRTTSLNQSMASDSVPMDLNDQRSYV